MTSKLLTMLIAAVLSSATIADDAHHPEGDKKPTASTPAAQPAKASTPTPKKATISTDTEKQFAAGQEQMKKMLSQMSKIRQTKDPKERQRLMEEHMQTMRDGAQAMRSTGGGMMMNMMDCPMMGDKTEKSATQGCPMMGGQSSKMDMGKRADMLEKRMDMMQMMMEQMIEREGQKSPAP